MDGGGWIERLRSGAWLVRSRIVGYCWILLVFEVGAVLGLVFMTHHLVDPLGRPLGTDFVSFYAAGELANTAAPTAVYDPTQHFAIEQRITGADDIPYYAFYYPPVFLMICGVLARLPYGAALAVWLGATGAFYVLATRAIVPRPGTWLPILAFPACFLNIGHGQNAFLTAGLFAQATRLIDRSPGSAGVLFGMLCYKPQFAVLVPVALVFGRHWVALAAAGASAAALAGMSSWMYGFETWRAYAGLLPEAQSMFEFGAVGFEKMASAFSAIRLLGGGVVLGQIVQGVSIAVAAAAVARIWLRERSLPLRGMALAAGALMASPLVLDYDLVVAGVAGAWLTAERRESSFRPWEKTAMAVSFMIPLVARSVGAATHLPLSALLPPFLLMAALGSGSQVARRGQDI